MNVIEVAMDHLSYKIDEINLKLTNLCNYFAIRGKKQDDCQHIKKEVVKSKDKPPKSWVTLPEFENKYCFISDQCLRNILKENPILFEGAYMKCLKYFYVDPERVIRVFEEKLISKYRSKVIKSYSRMRDVNPEIKKILKKLGYNDKVSEI